MAYATGRLGDSPRRLARVAPAATWLLGGLRCPTPRGTSHRPLTGADVRQRASLAAARGDSGSWRLVTPGTSPAAGAPSQAPDGNTLLGAPPLSTGGLSLAEAVRPEDDTTLP